MTKMYQGFLPLGGLQKTEEEFAIFEATVKTKSVLSKYTPDKVRVAYSGGSDSDVVMHHLRECGYDVTGVLYDTGVEWQATLDHVEYMRGLGFKIEVIRAVRPVPTSNRVYGHPFINKRVSDYLQRLQSNGFDFQKHGALPFEDLLQMYPRSKAALRWWCNEWGDGSSFNIQKNSFLKEFLIEHGLPFRVSGKCCDGAKKLPIKQYSKENGIELMILGIRKAERGVRSGAYSSCYVKSRSYTYDMYFPLFWWDDKTKLSYEESRKISHSSCYSDYGMKRTGCAGCPFGLNLNHELAMLDKHEPKKARGIRSIFSPVYEWTAKYREYQTDKREFGFENGDGLKPPC